MTQFPRIHMNGTDGGVLGDEYLDALGAVDAAIKAVGAITVHGRDYYVLATATGPDPSVIAYREHASRLARLLTVRDELTAIAENIAEQNDERMKRQ